MQTPSCGKVCCVMEAGLCNQLSSMQPALSGSGGALEGAGLGLLSAPLGGRASEQLPTLRMVTVALSYWVWVWEDVRIHRYSCLSCQLAGLELGDTSRDCSENSQEIPLLGQPQL